MGFRQIRLGAVAMGLAALAGCDSGSGSSAADKPATPPLAVTAKEVSAAFHENEAKAKLAYEGKTLLVSGVVKDIDLSLGDTPLIKLIGAGDKFGMGVTQDGKITDVTLSGLSKEQAAAVSKGEQLTFTCSDADEIMGGVQLDECQPSASPPVPAQK